MSKRDESIDILKGIGILLVLVAHSLGGFISQISYTFHMPMFFIVTGLFIHVYDVGDNRETFCCFLLKCLGKDFKRLVIPALFTTIVIVIFSCLTYWNIGVEYLKCPIDLIWKGFSLKDMDFFPMLGNLWFLFALFWGKQYFYIICYICKRNKIESLILLASFICGGVAIALNLYVVLPFCISVGLSVLPFICIGYILKCRGGVNSGIPVWGCWLVPLWIVYIFWGKLRVGTMTYSWGYILDVFSACGGTYSCYMLSISINKYTCFLRKFFLVLGQYSILLICAPTIETYCFPFQYILPQMPVRFVAVIFCKVLWCMLFVFLATSSPLLKRVFMIK